MLFNHKIVKCYFINKFIYLLCYFRQRWEQEVAAAAKSLQSCLTLCDPRDGSPPGSSVHGVFQARVLEWGAIAFSDPLS